MSEKDEAAEAVIWQVTNTEGEGINLLFGPKLSAMPFDDDDKLRLVGKALIGLGTRLMTSTTGEGDEDYDDDGDER